MQTANPHEIAGRTDKAKSLAKEILRRAAEQHIATDSAALIFWVDGFSDTREWFQVWRASRVCSPPSNECKAEVRKLLLSRLSVDELVKTFGPGGPVDSDEPYQLTHADRCELLERETAAALRSHDVSTWGEP